MTGLSNIILFLIDHTCAVLVDPYNGKVHQTGKAKLRL